MTEEETWFGGVMRGWVWVGGVNAQGEEERRGGGGRRGAAARSKMEKFKKKLENKEERK